VARGCEVGDCVGGALLKKSTIANKKNKEKKRKSKSNKQKAKQKILSQPAVSLSKEILV
jgi:hypothetical protein